MMQHSPLTKHQPGTQAQHAFLTCPPDRTMVSQLADEAEHRLTEAGGIATILSYGIAPKQKNGYIVLDAARGVPLAFFSWLREEPDVLDYIVYDVPCYEQERQVIATQGSQWYAPQLDAPELPSRYSLLAEPISLDRPSDELWLARVSRHTPYEGEGILVYGEDHEFFFFTAEEAVNITAYLLAQARPVIARCSQEFLQAPQHAQRLAILARAFAATVEEME